MKDTTVIIIVAAVGLLAVVYFISSRPQQSVVLTGGGGGGGGADPGWSFAGSIVSGITDTAGRIIDRINNPPAAQRT